MREMYDSLKPVWKNTQIRICAEVGEARWGCGEVVALGWW